MKHLERSTAEALRAVFAEAEAQDIHESCVVHLQQQLHHNVRIPCSSLQHAGPQHGQQHKSQFSLN